LSGDGTGRRRRGRGRGRGFFVSLGAFVFLATFGVLIMAFMLAMISMVARCQTRQGTGQLIIITIAHSIHLGRPAYLARLVRSRPIKFLSPV
jgi:hypothetical protein